MPLLIHLKRKFTSYSIKDFLSTKAQVLKFSKGFSTFCFLDNHGYEFKKSYECIAGAGSIKQFVVYEHQMDFSGLDKFIDDNRNDWIFGQISYDLKNDIEDLRSYNADRIQFPKVVFFVPEIVFTISSTYLQIGILHSARSDDLYGSIINHKPFNDAKQKVPALKDRFSKKRYVDVIRKLKNHILKGDCYELNFCQEFYAINAIIDPVLVYEKLTKTSPNPFSAFYKSGGKYLMCASPERFLKKMGNAIISQPIKGTAKRVYNDKRSDALQKKSLFRSKKERSENIMIVDLVRNDLSKICKEGSVHVEELLGVYSFPQVHQMISTVRGVLKEKIKFSEILKATFPMGSMTRAPKKKVMELIEKYELIKRGLFSGSIGYINPEGDFDFNVVIRSVQWNSLTNYLSVMAGSAITFNSIPEKEYEECLVKIQAMKEALQ